MDAPQSPAPPTRQPQLSIIAGPSITGDVQLYLVHDLGEPETLGARLRDVATRYANDTDDGRHWATYGGTSRTGTFTWEDLEQIPDEDLRAVQVLRISRPATLGVVSVAAWEENLFDNSGVFRSAHTTHAVPLTPHLEPE